LWLSVSVQGQPRKLKELFEDNLLRFCEEAVANAVIHARPTRIEVTLVLNSKEVQLRVRDNGCGFDTKRSKDGHFGLVRHSAESKINWRQILLEQPTWRGN
jgi:signal transduction histidine kinase